MQDTHPKIHDVDSREWEEEAQRIERGILKPSAQVIRVDDTSKTIVEREGEREGVFLHDGIVENFVPRRQRGQRARMNSIEDEKAEVSKENDTLLERMSAEQIKVSTFTRSPSRILTEFIRILPDNVHSTVRLSLILTLNLPLLASITSPSNSKRSLSLLLIIFVPCFR